MCAMFPVLSPLKLRFSNGMTPVEILFFLRKLREITTRLYIKLSRGRKLRDYLELGKATV